MTKETILASIVRELKSQHRADRLVDKFTHNGRGAFVHGILDIEQLAAAIERDVAIKWSSERPTVPGWYWTRNPRRAAEIAQVTLDYRQQQLVAWRGEVEDYLSQPDMADSQWAGPLKPPEES